MAEHSWEQHQCHEKQNGQLHVCCWVGAGQGRKVSWRLKGGLEHARVQPSLFHVQIFSFLLYHTVQCITIQYKSMQIWLYYQIVTKPPQQWVRHSAKFCHTHLHAKADWTSVVKLKNIKTPILFNNHWRIKALLYHQSFSHKRVCFLALFGSWFQKPKQSFGTIFKCESCNAKMEYAVVLLCIISWKQLQEWHEPAFLKREQKRKPVGSPVTLTFTFNFVW